VQPCPFQSLPFCPPDGR